MKILQVIPYFYPSFSYGGSPRVVYELTKKLVESGHELTVYTTDVFDSESRLKIKENPCDINGIRTFYFRNLSNRLAWNFKLFISPDLIAQAKRELRMFDIINLYESRSFHNAVIHHYAKAYGVPYTISALGSVLNTGGKRGLKRVFDEFYGSSILKDAAGVIAGPMTEVNEYLKMGVDKNRIIQIPMAQDTENYSQLPSLGRFREKYSIKEKHIILFLGRINKVKGIDFLIESFGKLTKKRNDSILVIVGPDDGYKPALENLIKKLDLSDKVIFTGFLDGEDKLCALVDATMLVQTSLNERGPGSPFQAVLCNTPIIVTKNTGCGEAVAEIDAGYLVDYGDINELVRLMQNIMDIPSEARDKTQRAKQSIISNLSWEKVIRDYERVYKSLSEQRRVK